jgi:hypothetical protein
LTSNSLYQNGHGSSGTLKFNYSNLYFEGIRRLLSTLLCDPRTIKLTVYLEQKTETPYPIDKSSVMSHSEPEALDIERRRAGLLMLKYLLDDWPRRFIEACRATGVIFYCLASPYLEYPFWIWKVYRKELLTMPYIPPRKEILAASTVLTRILDRRPTASELRRFMHKSYKLKCQYHFKPTRESLSLNIEPFFLHVNTYKNTPKYITIDNIPICRI